MKNIYKIFTYLLILPLFALACNQETELEYEPGTAELSNSYGVYFPVQDASGNHTYDPEMQRSVSVTVARPADKSTGAITVPYTLTASAEGIFEAGDITFADGQTETKLNVTFDKADVGIDYSFTLVIDDPAYCYVYGSNPTSFNFSVLIVTWEYILNPKTGEPALFEFTQDYWGETAWAYIKYYEVNGVRTCHTESNGKHVYNEPYEAPGFFGTAEDLGTDGELYFNMYMNEKNSDGNVFVELIPHPVYINPNYPDTPVYIFDYYYFWTVYQDSLGNSQGITNTWLEFAKNYEASYPVGYYDGNGGIYFYVRSYGMYGVGGWTEDAIDIVGIGEGFTRVDYSLSLEQDYTVDGVTPIYVEAGVDVKSLKYAVYEGELTAAQVAAKVEAIKDGSEESETFSDFEIDEEKAVAYGVIGIDPETTGAYTVAVVAYDAEGKAQNDDFIVVNHIGAADAEEYAVTVAVGAEAVPARYGDYDPTASFAFYVTGKGVTDARISYFKTSDYAKDPETCKLNVKAAKSVSSDIIAQINAAGGYYGIINKLSPSTSYTVVVWATNGDTDAYATTEYTTEGLPLELVGVGTYTYDGWWSGADDEQSLFIDPNYENTYVLTNWGGGVDFTFTMDKDGIIYIPTFAIGASHSSYGTVYYVDPFDWYSEASLAEDETKAVHSYYDAETKTYNFHFVLAVSAGSFGHFWESFILNEDIPAEDPAGAPKFSKGLASVNSLSKASFKWQAPMDNIISVERDLQPVKVSVSLPAARKEKAAKGKLADARIER